jgi:hypothetical protein
MHIHLDAIDLGPLRTWAVALREHLATYQELAAANDYRAGHAATSALQQLGMTALELLRELERLNLAPRPHEARVIQAGPDAPDPAIIRDLGELAEEVLGALRQIDTTHRWQVGRRVETTRGVIVPGLTRMPDLSAQLRRVQAIARLLGEALDDPQAKPGCRPAGESGELAGENPKADPSPAISWGNITLVTGGFLYRGKRYPLSGKPWGVLGEFLRDRFHVRTAQQLRDALWDKDAILDHPDQAVKDTIGILKDALRAARKDAGTHDPEFNPIPCVDRTPNLAYELKPLP